MSSNRPDRILLHVKDARRLVIEAEDIYYLEAAGDETVVRRHGRRTLRDVRSLGEVMPVFEKSGLYRIHRGWAVNPRRIREIRLQQDGRDWEVAMLPPVNKVLPVSRDRLRGLLRHFGE